MAQRPLMTSLVKATQVMDLLIERNNVGDDQSLSAIAAEMELPLNSVHSILRTLCACGYARQVKRGEYAVGPKLVGLIPEPEIDEQKLRPRVIQMLKQCASQQGEGYVCSILRDGERHIFASVQSGQAVAINRTVLDDASFYSKVSCRVLAAYCPKHELQKLLVCQGWPGSEWPEASTPPRFHAALDQIRQRGYLLMHDRQWDVVTIACPLFTRRGSFWGTLGSYAPHFRMGPKRHPQWIEHLRNMGREMVIES